jgi:hypothetical protein
MGLKSPVCEPVKIMINEINKILDYGNCGIARFCGEEAYIKVVSLRTETFYKVDSTGKMAQHIKALGLVGEIKNEVVQRINMQLPREVSSSCFLGLNLPDTRSGSASNGWIVWREVSRSHSSLWAENGERNDRSFKRRNPRIIVDEGLNRRSGYNRNYLGAIKR